MEPITFIDASHTKEFRLPVNPEALLLEENPNQLYDKEFMAIFMLTVVLQKTIDMGIHSVEGKNVILIVDDSSLFTSKYKLEFFSYLTHKSFVIEVIDQYDDIVQMAKNSIVKYGNNKCFMIFNTPCHNIDEIVSEIKPVVFSFVNDISCKDEVFTHFFALQYAIPETKLIRMFVFLDADENYKTQKYDKSKMLNLMLDVSKSFNHDEWIDSIIRIYTYTTNEMRNECSHLRKLLSA